MTANKNTESSQGHGGPPPPPHPPPHPGQPEQPASHNGNTVFKSGPLFISSKGIGWTSWKKRWFILTRTSLIFFRSDPSAISQKGGEVNLTLGGIDLNNSGSVVVKADKKLLTVIFPDGRDGRGFTLKAETLEDLNEWKTALENALAQAPNAALVGQNGIFKNDHADETDGSSEQLKDKPTGKSLVIGRPILLALEDVDGSPSFLEKALRFIEEYGIKVEGILRQAADVDDVERRIREYEQGKMEFSPEEDAHVIGDCVKYVLRELPSSPVPASCCNALLEACRTDRGSRVNAMRAAICETFPEPNRLLLQRILVMMQTVASHKAVNRMSTSAVAACMAPLLLRPLLAGDCEIETNIDVGGDGSIQLLKAAAAANHAQAIIITLLEEYNNIFSEGSMSPGLYSDSEECESEDEEVTDDDDEYYEDDEDADATQESDSYTEDDLDSVSGETCCESSASGEDAITENKVRTELGDTSSDFDSSSTSEDLEPELRTSEPCIFEIGSDVHSSGSKSSEVDDESKSELVSPSSVRTSLSPRNHVERSEKSAEQSENSLSRQKNTGGKLLGDISRETMLENRQSGCKTSAPVQKSISISHGPLQGTKRPTVWGRTSARKNLSTEYVDYPFEDEVEIQKLEASKIELQSRISEEVKGNAVLQANLEQRKKALHERRLALERDVARLQEQLQKERDKRMGLEAGLSTSRRPLPVPATIDEKLKADIEEINQAGADITNLNQKFDELRLQVHQQLGQNNGSMRDSSNQPLHTSNNQAKVKDKQKERIAASAHVSGSSANKDVTLDGTDSDYRHESTHSPHNQQVDQARNRSSKHASSNSNKHSARSERPPNSTTSALTKLTTRLNFLKERRSQIANELQSLDKGRSSGQTVTGKGGGSEGSQSAQKPDRGLTIDGQLAKNLDGGLDLDVQPAQMLDRVKSEGHTPHNAEEVQQSEGQLLAMRRNNTR